MIVRFYVDVAGSEHEHRAITAAGYISSDAQWAYFRHEWKKVLDKAGASLFHANEFFPRNGRFKHLKPKSEMLRHQALAREFATVAYECLSNGFSFTIDCDSYEDELSGVIGKMKTPHSRLTASTMAIAAICNRAAQRCLPPTSGNQGLVFIEDGSGTGETIAYLRQLKRDGEPWTAAFLEFSPVPKSEYGVQAADFLAYEAWLESTRVLEEPDRNDNWGAVNRDTFKILATGPGMVHPLMGTARVNLDFATKEHFRTWVPQMLAFIAAHPQYRRAPWWRGWRRTFQKWRNRKKRDAMSYVKGRAKRLYFGARKRLRY